MTSKTLKRQNKDKLLVFTLNYSYIICLCLCVFIGCLPTVLCKPYTLLCCRFSGSLCHKSPLLVGGHQSSAQYCKRQGEVLKDLAKYSTSQSQFHRAGILWTRNDSREIKTLTSTWDTITAERPLRASN